MKKYFHRFRFFMKFSIIISISAFFALHAGGGAGRTPKQGRQKGEGRATRAGGRVGVAQRRGRARGTPRGDLKWSRNEYKEKYFFTILDEIPSLALHRKSLVNRSDRLKMPQISTSKSAPKPDSTFFRPLRDKSGDTSLILLGFCCSWVLRNIFRTS